MRRHAVLLLPAALLCLAAAPAPKKPPAKPAPAARGFDSQNPQGLMGLLGDAGAKVQTDRREGDAVFVTVTSAAADFSVQFAGCGAQGRTCQAALFDGVVAGASPTLAQINAFNQTSVVCRIYQDKANRPHAIYAALLLRSDTRDSARTHLAAWQGCLAQARDFVRDPLAYHASAA
jgi:hypothetical protein